jgi:hypothetical protein
MLALEDRDPIILEGIPIMHLGRMMDDAGPSASPPIEASHEALESEPLLPSPSHHHRMMQTIPSV